MMYSCVMDFNQYPPDCFVSIVLLIYYHIIQYPKAKYHLLLMRRKNKPTIGNLSNAQTLNDLEPTHLQELLEFHTLGRNIIATLLKEIHNNDKRAQSSSNNNTSSISFKLGYHAIPSLQPLHLHIISTDLESPCITNRKHVVSFTSTLFFVEAASVERHLESAFVDKNINMVLTVRKERAKSVLECTPMTCTNCGREAVSGPDWKRHNSQCSEIAGSGGKGVASKLNSLLGWSRKVAPKTEESASNYKDEPQKQKASAKQDATDIVSMTPTNFTISESKSRYIIYMAITEKANSLFAHGLKKCDGACHGELKQCLQIDQTRHVTLYDGYLSPSQVRSLTFNGDFTPLDIGIDGWKPWGGGAYLSLSQASERELKKLLTKIDGIPINGTTAEEVKCDHLSLYRRRKETTMPYDTMKREFRSICEATESHSWGSVEGVGIRIKAFGSPYNECKVLADGASSIIDAVQSNAGVHSLLPPAGVPYVLVLIGLPGSGKTNFASRLANSMPSKFVRICQDEMGSRGACIDLARRTLVEGKVAIIDRTNVDILQRKHWFEVANEGVDRPYPCDCIIFEYDKDVCIRRCKERQGHSLSPNLAALVVNRMSKRYERPYPEENFRHIEYVTSFDMADKLVDKYLGQSSGSHKRKRA